MVARERSLRLPGEQLPAVSPADRLGLMRPLLVVHDAVRAVEASARDALFVTQRARAPAGERRVRLCRQIAEAQTLQHLSAPSATASGVTKRVVLFALDALEQGAEIACAEAAVALSLNQ